MRLTVAGRRRFCGGVADTLPYAKSLGVGFGATEAPRGLLYHRYALTEDGALTEARIIPPTAQNQTAIEEDVRRTVQVRLETAGPAADSAPS